eukprot:1012222-Pelagomonas_calceolata.AAC.1
MDKVVNDVLRNQDKIHAAQGSLRDHARELEALQRGSCPGFVAGRRQGAGILAGHGGRCEVPHHQAGGVADHAQAAGWVSEGDS